MASVYSFSQAYFYVSVGESAPPFEVSAFDKSKWSQSPASGWVSLGHTGRESIATLTPSSSPDDNGLHERIAGFCETPTFWTLDVPLLQADSQAVRLLTGGDGSGFGDLRATVKSLQIVLADDAGNLGVHIPLVALRLDGEISFIPGELTVFGLRGWVRKPASGEQVIFVGGE